MEILAQSLIIISATIVFTLMLISIMRDKK